MHLVIIGYYHLADEFLALAEVFRKNTWEVSFFPMLYYKQSSEWEKIFKKFLDGTAVKNSILCNKKIDVCLWWYDIANLQYDKLNYVINNKIIHICYNFDPSYLPCKDNVWKNKKKNKDKNSSLMNYVITVNPYEYHNLNHKNIFLCPPGYEEKYFFPKKDKKYICDVSIVCTNLYDAKEWKNVKQLINRKKIVDLIYNDKDIDFLIFGPQKFKSLYPKSYRGFLNYKDCNKVFYNSKINICIQAVSIDGYLSERVPQVFASGGLVLIDSKIGYGFEEGEDYILIDENNPLKQIKSLLKDPKKMKKIRENALKKSHCLKWDKLFNIVKNISIK